MAIPSEFSIKNVDRVGKGGGVAAAIHRSTIPCSIMILNNMGSIEGLSFTINWIPTFSISEALFYCSPESPVSSLQLLIDALGQLSPLHAGARRF